MCGRGGRLWFHVLFVEDASVWVDATMSNKQPDHQKVQITDLPSRQIGRRLYCTFSTMDLDQECDRGRRQHETITSCNRGMHHTGFPG